MYFFLRQFMFIAVDFRDLFLCVTCIQLPNVRTVLHKHSRNVNRQCHFKVYKNKINSIHFI